MTAKRPMGRPREVVAPVTVAASVPAKVRKALAKAAAAHGQTISKEIRGRLSRTLIEDGLVKLTRRSS